MKACCGFPELATRQRRVLQVVLWINASMFLAEFGASLVAHSTALLSDSVDMLGDAIVYGFSLYAVMRGPVWHARAALLKGSIMGVFGVGVLLEVAVKLVRGVVPSADLMGAWGPSPWSPTSPACLCWCGTAATTSTCGRPGCAPGTTWSQTWACSLRPPAWL